MASAEITSTNLVAKATGLAKERSIRGMHAIANGPFVNMSVDAQVLVYYWLNRRGFGIFTGPLPSPNMASDLVFYPPSGLPGEDGKVFASSYYPVPRLDINAMSFMPDTQIEADWARTANIATQVLTKDGRLYTSRLRTVYQRGIQRQKAWLDYRQALIIDGDPRITPRETLLREIMGEDRYLMDTGFKDYQKALDIWMDGYSPQSIRDIIIGEIEKVKEADRAIPESDYSQDSLEATISTFEELLGQAKERVDDSEAVRKLLGVIRGRAGTFIFERENFLNEYSMKRLIVAERILGNPELMDELRGIGPNQRATLMAHLLVYDKIKDLLDGRRLKKEGNELAIA